MGGKGEVEEGKEGSRERKGKELREGVVLAKTRRGIKGLLCAPNGRRGEEISRREKNTARAENRRTQPQDVEGVSRLKQKNMSQREDHRRTELRKEGAPALRKARAVSM